MDPILAQESRTHPDLRWLRKGEIWILLLSSIKKNFTSDICARPNRQFDPNFFFG